MPRKTNTQSNNPQTGNESMEDVNYSIDDLLDKAQDAIETLQPELAEKFYLKAMKLEPQNTFIMDDYAALLLEMDQFDKAKELLSKSMKLDPNSNPGKYMQLGQLHQGQEALKYYNRGIELMEKEKKDAIRDKENEQVAFLKTQIANALCSCAEVFLTDECFADTAEEECEKFLQRALKTDPKNPETLQTLASVRISQEKNDEALKLLTQSYDLWKDLHVTEKPSYEFRHNTAKLMMELDQPGHAADIWEDLVDEDDLIAEVHYHLGLAYSKLDKSSSLECLKKSKELLEKTGGEAELLAQVKQMIEDVKNDPTIPEYQSDGEVNAGNDEEEGDEEMMDEN